MIKLPRTIKMVITDFDGIVTDNCVYISQNGEMSRKLNFKDVMAFSVLKKCKYLSKRVNEIIFIFGILIFATIITHKV